MPINIANFSPQLNLIKNKGITFGHLQLHDKNPLAMRRGKRCSSITSEENILNL